MDRICFQNRAQCAAFKDGGCIALHNTAFKKDCPFFQCKKENLKATATSIYRLIRLERWDLLQLYHGIQKYSTKIRTDDFNSILAYLNKKGDLNEQSYVDGQADG